MTIEILGMVGTKDISESSGDPAGPQIDPGYLTRFARAHEAAGFDRVLIGYHATGPDGFAVAARVLSATSSLKVLIAHRPGFAAPTLVARKLATLDQLAGGGLGAFSDVQASIPLYFGGASAGHGRTVRFSDWGRELVPLLREQGTSVPVGLGGLGT